MVERLKLVDPIPEFNYVHPLLQDSALIIEHGTDGGASPNTVTFTAPINGGQLVEALHAPIKAFTPDATPTDIRQGLRSLTYPNSRIIKNARFIDPYARDNILGQRQQISGLLQVIDHPRHHDMVPAKIHVLNAFLGELAARTAITEMKPSNLMKLCDEHEFDYDALKIWRLKGGNRQNLPINVRRLGLDETELVRAYITKHYRQKITIPGAEPALIPVRDLPSWAHSPGFVELLRRLPDIHQSKMDEQQNTESDIDPDEIGDRWEVLLRREDTPRHIVRAKLSWQTDMVDHTYHWVDRNAEYHKQRYSWRMPFKHFTFGHTEPVYNPISHTIEHTSTLLGPILLLAAIESPPIDHALKRVQQGRHFKYWDNPNYSRKMAGFAVTLLQSPYIIQKIIDTKQFSDVEKLATQSS